MPSFYNPADKSPQQLHQFRITAYGYGKDNAYRDGKKKIVDGKGNIVHTSDPYRPHIDHNPQAHLGFGSYGDPSSAAVHPESGIPMNSQIYVPDRGWFVVEDHFNKNLQKNRIDMWTGKSNESQLKQLDAGHKNITIYPPGYKVPSQEQHSPSDQWVRHYSQMLDQGYATGRIRPPQSRYSQPLPLSP